MPSRSRAGWCRPGLAWAPQFKGPAPQHKVKHDTKKIVKTHLDLAFYFLAMIIFFRGGWPAQTPSPPVGGSLAPRLNYHWLKVLKAQKCSVGVVMCDLGCPAGSKSLTGGRGEQGLVG